MSGPVTDDLLLARACRAYWQNRTCRCEGSDWAYEQHRANAQVPCPTSRQSHNKVQAIRRRRRQSTRMAA